MVVKITFLSCKMCIACTTTQPSNAPPTSLWPIKQPSLITNWVYFCVSVICVFQSYGDTAETITKPRPEPQSKPQTIQARNHSRTNPKTTYSRIKPGSTAEPTPKPKLNQSYNRSQNYSQTNPTTAAEITLPLPECVSEITMCRPNVQQAQHI